LLEITETIDYTISLKHTAYRVAQKLRLLWLLTVFKKLQLISMILGTQ